MTALPYRRLSVAPMLGWTDHHYRYFARQITRQTWLYTEMVTTGALLHGHIKRHLVIHHQAHPLALQLGGCVPAELAQCAKLAQSWGYNEVNLNVGCPSERAQKGTFGACLMAQPYLVADCIKAMRDAVTIDVTIKHRIGINTIDDYDNLREFVDIISAAGCKTFIIHARNAILTGLNPKENRGIPPLKYDYVYRLKQERPELNIVINGGIKSDQDIALHLKHVDGVMVGRKAYQCPWWLASWDRNYYDKPTASLTRQQVAQAMLPYVAEQMQQGVSLRLLVRPMLGLFQGMPGARQWRRHLSDAAWLQQQDIRLLSQALAQL